MLLRGLISSKNMRQKYLFIYFIALLGVNAFALPPDWIERIPMAYSGADYYYRVASASDKTYEKAYAKAFNDAVEKSAHATGVPKDIFRDTLNSEVSVRSYIATSVPINVVCKYSEDLIVENGKKVHILVQVGRNADSNPKYRAFDCERNLEREEEK